MSYFEVPECEVRACLNWRPGDWCVKDHTLIPTTTPITITMQSIEICLVHQQVNNTRLHNLLEE